MAYQRPMEKEIIKNACYDNICFSLEPKYKKDSEKSMKIKEFDENSTSLNLKK
jgi:hypothetical protein